MNKFWQWIEEKNYGYAKNKSLYHRTQELCFPSKQMLTGFYMEFCFTHGIEFNIDDTNVNRVLEEAITNWALDQEPDPKIGDRIVTINDPKEGIVVENDSRLRHYKVNFENGFQGYYMRDEIRLKGDTLHEGRQ